MWVVLEAQPGANTGKHWKGSGTLLSTRASLCSKEMSPFPKGMCKMFMVAASLIAKNWKLSKETETVE